MAVRGILHSSAESIRHARTRLRGMGGLPQRHGSTRRAPLAACQEGGYAYHYGTIGYGVFHLRDWPREFRKSQAAGEIQPTRKEII